MASDRHLRVLETCGTPLESDHHPFKESSTDCLTLLLRLSLDRGQVKALLLNREYGKTNEGTRASSQYARLAQLIREDPNTACLVDEQCGQQFSDVETTASPCSVYELACAWSRLREQLDGPAAAALLWTVARARPHCYRKLEAAIVEDLNHTAVRCLTLVGHEYPSCDGELPVEEAS